MTTLLTVLLGCYLLGGLLPLCTSRPHLQNSLAHSSAAAGGSAGIALGLGGLFAAQPLTISVPSNIPYLT
ncbi:MAG TPA: hypothetical protein PKW52_11085, partial [Nitrospira sp.]|nr:hypothetical protein [Nitrospira sp.]